MLLIFFQTLQDDKPQWENKDGIIGSNPGLGFRPSPDQKYIESTLIWYRSGTANGNWEPWVMRLKEFLNVSIFKRMVSVFFERLTPIC